MRKPKECNVIYLGYGTPISNEETQLEILGLRKAKSEIDLKIKEFEMALFLAEMASSRNLENIQDLFGGSHASLHGKDGKREED